ncbi:hypothetical protein K501DRAFT_284889 [Backusella circina FSU 941]|nr:hypothetical protein K501DRAFT_284889 [Backusella circina FSU 941]
MFSNITDHNDVQSFIDNLTAAVSAGDQKVDLFLALPSLKSLLQEYSPDMGDEHYSFLGESAFYFAVNCLLAKKLRQYDDQLLRLTARQFRNIQSFAIPLFLKTKLEKYVRTGEIKSAFLSITGILYRFLGIDTVMQFIEPAVTEILAPKKMQHSPVYILNHRCASNGGRIEIKYNQGAPNIWKANILCKLNRDSTTFTTEASCSSKLKARTVCCQMVLSYLKENPAEEEKLEAYNSTTDVYKLPVVQPELDMDMNEDVQSIQPTIINNKCNQTSVQIPSQKQEDTFKYIAYEGDDEDTIERLSNLLLGPEERAGNKRQRKTEGIFDDMKTNIKVKVEPVAENFVNSNGMITPSPTFITNNDKSSNYHTPVVMDMEMDNKAPPGSQPNQMENPQPTNQYTLFTAPEATATAKGLFQKIFKSERVKMRGLKKSYDAKGAILSYIPSKPQNITVNVEIKSAGGAQDPHFVADLEIKCANPAIALYTKGAAKKKREAESQAYCRLIETLLDPNPE